MAFHLHEIIIQLNIFPFTWERGHNLPLIHVDWTYLSPFAGNSNTRVKNTGGKNGIPIICGYECSPWCYLYNNAVILAESLYSTLTEHRESWLVYPDTVTTCDELILDRVEEQVSDQTAALHGRPLCLLKVLVVHLSFTMDEENAL